MQYYSVVYCYDDMSPIDYLYDYRYNLEQDEPETSQSSVFWPVFLYSCFWTTSLGTFAYQYCKVHNKTNQFVNTIDKCVNYVFPAATPAEKLMKSIRNFNIENLNPVTDEEEETDDEAILSEGVEWVSPRSGKTDVVVEDESDDMAVTESDEEYFKNDIAISQENIRKLPPTPIDSIDKIETNPDLLTQIINEKLGKLKEISDAENKNDESQDAQNMGYDMINL